MIDIRVRLFKKIKDQRIFSMSPKDCSLAIVENVLLDASGLVDDEFIQFMSEFLQRFYAYNCESAPLFAHIAMSRISYETMMFTNHKQSSWVDTLKTEYGYDLYDRCPSSIKKRVNFDSIVAYPGLLNEACGVFLTKQADFIMTHGGLSEKAHMKKILFTIANDFDNESGSYESIFVVNTIDGKNLSDFAKVTLYKYCSIEEIMDEIANNNVYKKHLEFLKKNWYSLEKSKFAKAIGLKGPFKKWRLKRIIFSK